MYSDLNLITLGVLVDRVSGQAARQRWCAPASPAPLGMVDTGYNPPAAKLDRIAATEYQASPSRGMVRGCGARRERLVARRRRRARRRVLHRAATWPSLGQTILNGGTYAGRRILTAATRSS